MLFVCLNNLLPRRPSATWPLSFIARRLLEKLDAGGPSPASLLVTVLGFMPVSAESRSCWRCGENFVGLEACRKGRLAGIRAREEM